MIDINIAWLLVSWLRLADLKKKSVVEPLEGQFLDTFRESGSFKTISIVLLNSHTFFIALIFALMFQKQWYVKLQVSKHESRLWDTVIAGAVFFPSTCS